METVGQWLWSWTDLTDLGLDPSSASTFYPSDLRQAVNFSKFWFLHLKMETSRYLPRSMIGWIKWNHIGTEKVLIKCQFLWQFFFLKITFVFHKGNYTKGILLKWCRYCNLEISSFENVKALFIPNLFIVRLINVVHMKVILPPFYIGDISYLHHLSLSIFDLEKSDKHLGLERTFCSSSLKCFSTV